VYAPPVRRWHRNGYHSHNDPADRPDCSDPRMSSLGRGRRSGVNCADQPGQRQNTPARFQTYRGQQVQLLGRHAANLAQSNACQLRYGGCNS
jgi:hypothetical protein